MNDGERMLHRERCAWLTTGALIACVSSCAGAAEQDTGPLEFTAEEFGTPREGFTDEPSFASSFPADVPRVCRIAPVGEAEAAPSTSLSANGTSPTLFLLPPRQLLAAGLVRVRGRPCSGTLIAPSWVVTAKHCVDVFDNGQLLDPFSEIEFLTGADPNLPDKRIVGRSVYLHPDAGIDLALVELAIPSEGTPPDISPILLARNPDLDQILDAEAAGYGTEADGHIGRRHFYLEEIIDWTELSVDVQSRAEDGLCFGDSGGPLLIPGPSGEPRLLGTLWQGSADCSGRDRFVRADTQLEWFDKVMYALPTECDDTSGTPFCEGSVLAVCADGVKRTMDCNQCTQLCREEATGAICSSEFEGPSPSAPTPSPTAQGNGQPEAAVSHAAATLGSGADSPHVVADAGSSSPSEPGDSSFSPEQAHLVAGVLDGYRLEVPCASEVNLGSSQGGCETAPEHDRQRHLLTLGGDPAVLYQIELHVRGVAELIPYLGVGERVGAHTIRGGAPSIDDVTTTTFALNVDLPHANFFLNHRGGGGVFARLDDTFVIEARGGALITLKINPPPSVADGIQRNNSAGIIAAGNDLGPQPYRGQFLQLRLVSVTPGLSRTELL